MTGNCPFGEGLQKYWERRYTLFSRFDEGVELDAEGLYSACPEEIALRIASQVVSPSILDGFCGAGGNAIAFARAGKRVWSADTNKSRLRMAQHNASIYDVQDSITFLDIDFFDAASHVHAGAVYLDPPWGGPSYVKKETFKLDDFLPSGKSLLSTSFERFDEVIIRVPRTFDFSGLQQFGRDYRVEDDIIEGRLVSKTVFFSIRSP